MARNQSREFPIAGLVSLIEEDRQVLSHLVNAGHNLTFGRRGNGWFTIRCTRCGHTGRIVDQPFLGTAGSRLDHSTGILLSMVHGCEADRPSPRWRHQPQNIATDPAVQALRAEGQKREKESERLGHEARELLELANQLERTLSSIRR